MAMTKKEQEAMKEAIDRANLLAALRWTEPVSKDLPPPSHSWKPGSTESRYTEGWAFNDYNKTVYQAWSESISHGTGPYPSDSRYRSASQRPLSMFSTKLLALKALRHAVEKIAAADLMEIDRQIAAEQTEAA